MAIYPCAFVPHRYFEAQQTAYYTCVMDHVVKTYRARLCPMHFTHVAQVAIEVLNNLEDHPMPSKLCEICGDERLLTAQIRLFPRKEEQQQLVADLCGPCGMKLELGLHTADWEPLPER